MSVDPKEAAAFANILGKLDGVKQGTETVDVNAGRAKRMADNDMTSILSAFNNTSGTQSALTLTPQALTESAEPKKGVQEDTLGDIKSRLTDYRVFRWDTGRPRLRPTTC